MIYRTQKNTIPFLAGTSPLEILGPNPRRKAIVLTPIPPGTDAGTSVSVASFTFGAGQLWQVPPRVTNVVDAYVFGAGGIAGASGVALGGGGGGGGGFADSGPQTVIGGQIWTVDVPNSGSTNDCFVTDASAAIITKCASGANGLLDAPGAGGAGVTGVQKFTGGAGAAATLLAGAGGGGGGGAGSFAAGSAGAASVGGAGGGAATIASIGAGGAGGDGGASGAPGLAGTLPGGGAGGSGDNDASMAVAGHGFAAIFYLPGTGGGAISMDPRSDVAVGRGTLNWISGVVFPLVITDLDIGSAITEPWFIVATEAATFVQVTEYLYTDPADYLEC